MPRTRQEGVSLPIPKWDWIHDNHRKFGFQHKSWFINHCIDYALKNDERFRNPNNALKDLQKFDEIGNIATERRQKKFSLVKAVDDFEEDVEGLRKLHRKGWITKEQLKQEIKRSEEQHKKVVQLELSKKRKTGEELEKPKFKSKEERLRWYRQQIRLERMKEKTSYIAEKFSKAWRTKARCQGCSCSKSQDWRLCIGKDLCPVARKIRKIAMLDLGIPHYQIARWYHEYWEERRR